jgi:hypothetical protein
MSEDLIRGNGHDLTIHNFCLARFSRIALYAPLRGQD